jgi:hypothetical protein|nr:MAG TPA: hypothetical protein [Caudoviricetes sp.]
MAESLKTVLMSALTSKATPAESDTLIVGEGNVLKKISFSQLFTYLKDKLGINSLNTNLTTNISVAHVLGTSFCVYNSQFVFVHIGVEIPSKLEAKDTLAILPSDIKMQAVGNIGIVSTAGSIASISIENNIVYANPTFPQGYYFIDLVLKRA